MPRCIDAGPSVQHAKQLRSNYKVVQIWPGLSNWSTVRTFLNSFLPNLTSIGPCIVIYLHSKTNQMHQCIKFILFWNDTLHVSDGLSVHHQEFKTVHTATGMWNRYCCRLASGYSVASSQQCLFGCCMYSSWTADDGRKDRPKHVECRSKIK